MDPVGMEEERRLCYVGMTRAKERLYLVYASERSIYGSISSNMPSRFIANIPPRLIKEARSHPRRGVYQAPFPGLNRSAVGGEQQAKREFELPKVSRDETAEHPKPKKTLPSEIAFKPGDKVRHPKFGEGIVVSASVLSDDQEVVVAFPEIGVKRLSLSFAPLEKV